MQLLEQGILWRLLNGSMQSNDLAYHWSLDGSDSCIFCGQRDTLEHRWWTCPATAPFREIRSLDFQQRGLTCSTAARVHGWFPRAVTTKTWFALLDSLSEVGPSVSLSPAGSVVDLFTDGSAFMSAPCGCLVGRSYVPVW